MKKIAITIGDPAGIGPEVTVKSVSEVLQGCIPVVIGDTSVIKEALSVCGISLKLKPLETLEDVVPSKDILLYIDAGSSGPFTKNRPDRENGIACVTYIKKAVELALEQKVDGVVTAPISKESLKLAGYPWPGHTEMLAELTGADEYAMMLVGDRLRVILVTIHLPLRTVPDLIVKEAVLKTIRLAKRACTMLGIEKPSIAVAGLNPHAGEGGILGTEEMNEIVPAIKDAQREGISVKGPYPPDVVFHKAYRGDVDMVVCMYHDQGLIPLKMIAFDRGVNVTVGLPIIRTSPDHGTAYDIAWKGIASPSSMIEAIRLAVRLTL